MVNESDTPYRPDYFPNSQPSARDLPRPTFGKPQDVRGGNVKHVRTVAWSCDGRRIATGGEFKELLVWDAKSSIDSKPSATLPSSNKASPHNGHIGAIAWSPVDPNVLISGDKGSSAGGVVAIWNLSSTSSPLATFKISGDVLHIAFHPSGRHFAVVCPQRNKDEVFFFWLTEMDGKEVWARREDVALGGALMDIGSEEINSLRFTNSGKLVCAVSNDGSINAWLYPLQHQIQEEEEPIEAEPPVPESGPSTTPSSPKATADDDALLTGKSRAASPREDSPDPAGKRDGEGERDDKEGAGEGDVEMAEDGRDGEEPKDGGEKKDEDEAKAADVEELKVEVEAPEEDIEKKEAVNGNGNGNGEQSTEPSGDVEMTESAQTGPEKPSTPLPLSSAPPSRRPTPPPEKANEARTREQEKRKARQLQRFRHTVCHSASLLSLGFDPQGKYLAVGGQDALLSMFDTKDWICERTYDVCTAAIRHIAFSSDGEYIALGGDDTFIAIVSIYTGATIAKLPVHGMVNALAWHPKKNWLAYSHSGKTSVPIWHVVHQDA